MPNGYSRAAPDGNTGLFLRDGKDIARLRIYVSKENKPLIRVLDDQGQPIATP